MTDPRRDVVRVFLSHRYKSAEVNLRLFEQLTKDFDVRFAVDDGLERTSTTRLERLIRESDAFVGFHSLPDDLAAVPDVALLRTKSRYFRLETEMAVRARRPVLLFADQRYGSLMNPGRALPEFRFDARELRTGMATRTLWQINVEVRSFQERFDDRSAAAHHDGRSSGDRTVGLLLPAELSRDSAVAAAVESAVERVGRTPRWLAPGAVLTGDGFAKMRGCEWVVVDRATTVAAETVAFLHGSGIPVLRTARAMNGTGVADRSGEAETSGTFPALFGDLDSHFQKSTVVWTDPADLSEQFDAACSRVAREPRLVATAADAEAYFRSASKRNDLVFLSYSKHDGVQAEAISVLLHERFQAVYDYRNAPNPLGENWLPYLTQSLAKSTVGIALVSDHWKNSTYCVDEGTSMLRHKLDGTMRVFPVLLGDEVRRPDLFGNIQYFRWSGQSAAEVVEHLMNELDNKEV